MAASTSIAAPAPAPSAKLAPGFRFHPTDEELVSYYLKRRLLGRPIRVDAIRDVDLYKLSPWDLPPLASLRGPEIHEWYFFCHLARRASSAAAVTCRATPEGYWKTTGKDRNVLRGFGSTVVGVKKTLVFHAGRAPRGRRTNWVMHEYHLVNEELARSGVVLDDLVICRIFQKKSSATNGGAPSSAAQNAYPTSEEDGEDWEDEAVKNPINGEVDAPDDDKNLCENAELEKQLLPAMIAGKSSSQVLIPGHHLKMSDNLCSRNEASGTINCSRTNHVSTQMLAPTVEQPQASSEPSNMIEEFGAPGDITHVKIIEPHPQQLNFPMGFAVGDTLESFFDAPCGIVSADQPLSDTQLPGDNSNQFYTNTENLSFSPQINGLSCADICVGIPCRSSSGFDVLDDLINYYEATNDKLHYANIDALEELASANPSKSQLFLPGAGSAVSVQDTLPSHGLADASHCVNSEKVVAGSAPAQSPIMFNNPFMHHLVDWLGSYPSSPANAAERAPKVAILSKNATYGFKRHYSCRLSAREGCRELIRTSGGLTGFLLRGMVCCFLFSAFILTISCQ